MMSNATATANRNSPEKEHFLRRSARFNRWLDRRMPPANSVSFNQRNIFIMPNARGIYFALFVAAMVLAGINYQNSLIFALAFLLTSLFMVGILHTYRNLSGITLVAGSARPAFAGDEAEFTVVLKRLGDRTYESIQAGWNPALLASADLIEGQEQWVKSFVKATRRGRLNPGRGSTSICRRFSIPNPFPVARFRPARLQIRTRAS